MKKILILACLVSGDAHADIYKCQDSAGKLTFSDRPCADKSEQQILQQSKRIETDADAPAAETRDGSCAASVSNAREWLASMREVGQRNVSTGHMKQIDYDRGLVELDKLSRQITTADCNNAQDKKRQFYACLSKITNHLSLCMQRHNPF